MGRKLKYTRRINVGLTDEQHKLYKGLGGADAVRAWLDGILGSPSCLKCRKDLPKSGWFNTKDGTGPYCDECSKNLPSRNFVIWSDAA